MTKARLTIFQHIQSVRCFIGFMVGELLERHNAHDRSKMTAEELPAYERHAQAQAEAEYGSDEHAQAMLLVKDALTFHYSRNRHHPEHFPNGVDDMTLIDLCEMLADWMDASRRYNHNGSFKKSMEHNAKRFKLSDQTVRLLENTARWLEEVDKQSPCASDPGGPHAQAKT